MRLKRSSAYTYLGILDDVYYKDEDISIEFINNLLSNFRQIGNALPYTIPIFFILDYTKTQYVTFTGGIQTTLYDPREFLEGGIGFLLHIYHPDDFKVYNEKIFNANISFLKSIPQHDHDKYVFSYNFRFRNAGGEWLSVYQRSTYITAKETGLPLYNVGMVSDITAFKTDTVMLHTIEHFKDEGGDYKKNLVQKNFFYPYEEDTLLSHREKEVLKRMADGLSSKQIADLFFLSENTVVNHRKNMLRKTNTRNVAELIAYCLKNKII